MTCIHTAYTRGAGAVDAVGAGAGLGPGSHTLGPRSSWCSGPTTGSGKVCLPLACRPPAPCEPCWPTRPFARAAAARAGGMGASGERQSPERSSGARPAIELSPAPCHRSLAHAPRSRESGVSQVRDGASARRGGQRARKTTSASAQARALGAPRRHAHRSPSPATRGAVPGQTHVHVLVVQ